jgi:hypothetical protein
MVGGLEWWNWTLFYYNYCIATFDCFSTRCKLEDLFRLELKHESKGPHLARICA